MAQDKGVATTVPGILAMHCFVVTGGKILMFPTSCTCVPCLAMQYDKCDKVASGSGGKERRWRCGHLHLLLSWCARSCAVV